MKHSFFLVIPNQDPNSQRSKAFETKFVEQWLAELPIGNPLLAARLFHEYVADANTVKMPTQTRLDAFDLIKPSFYTIKSFLSGKLTRIDFPKEEDDRKTFKLLMSLEKQLALGYWIALKELAESDKSWFQRRNPLPPIHCCFQRLTSIAISHHMMGLPIPDWIWLDLHSLYELTLDVKKDDALIALTDISYLNKSANPEDDYLRVVLLSLAEPSGLTPKEIKLTYDFITTIQPFVSIKKEPVKKQETQCVLFTGEDRSPRFLSPDELEAAKNDSKSMFYVDFTSLYQAFAQGKIQTSEGSGRFSNMRTGEEAQGKPSGELLDYLKQRWTGVRLEGDTLFADRQDRYIAIGMTSTFKLQKAIATGTEDAEILVQSASKKQLSGAFSKTGVLSVGSLVSFRKIDVPEHKRFIGIVNTLTADKDETKLSFGIQLLAHQSIPVTYQSLGTRDKNTKSALFYKSDSQNPISFIITDTFRLREGDIVLLSINQESFPIILSNKTNVGLGYWRFECRKVVEKSKYVPPIFNHEPASLSGQPT